jgi:predicted esterase
MRPIQLIALPALLLAGPAIAADYPGVVNDFIPFNFDRYGNGMETNSNDLPGRVFVPASYDPNTPMPIVLFLHGAGETGSSDAGNSQPSPNTWNYSQVTANINNLKTNASNRGFIIYAPQTWGGWGIDSLDNAINQIANLKKTYNIDTSRIYVTGLSLGGGGVIDIAAAYNHVFAAAVDICGALKDMPLWIHHAQNDTTVNVSASRNRVNGIRNAKGLGNTTFTDGVPLEYDDGILRYSERTTGGHGIWSSVFNTAAVYDWMLSKNNSIPNIQAGQTLLFDFGFNAQRNVDSQGRTWNSTEYGLFSVNGPVRAFARTTTGQGTLVNLEVSDTFNGEFSLPATPFTGDAWYVTPTDSGAVTLSDLNLGLIYDIELFASRTSNNGTTRFIINGVIKDLYHFNNVSNTVTFEDVLPNPDGTITIQVLAAPGSTNGYLNWMSVTAAVPEPASVTLLLAPAAMLLRRRRR